MGSTDITLCEILYKRTGGIENKKGYLKNSQKISLKNSQLVINAIKDLEIDHLFCSVKMGFGTKKHRPTMRSVCKILESFEGYGFKKYPVVRDLSPVSISTIRLKGGRRGRR